MRTTLNEAGNAGYAIKPNGELVSVFRDPVTSEKGIGKSVVAHAIDNGATHLDVLDGKLKSFYESFGFEEYKREPNWTKGKPDVVFMKLNPEKYAEFQANNPLISGGNEGAIPSRPQKGGGSHPRPGGNGANVGGESGKALQKRLGSKSLTGDKKAMEARGFEDIAKNKDALISEYIQKNGNVVNTDNARELFPEYRADRSRSAVLHEPASYLGKEIYAKLLKDNVGKGNGRVLFTSGGTGAGKSTGLQVFGNINDYSVVFDTNMNTLQSSVDKIDAALAKGYKVDVLHTYRDPIEALQNGALPRAERMGRTVPINEHAKTHLGSLDTMSGLSDHYADNPNVNLHAVDNSFGKGKAVYISQDTTIDFLGKKRQSIGSHGEVTAKLRQTLEQEYKAGRISKKTYDGFQ